jgi:hypothetical protein
VCTREALQKFSKCQSALPKIDTEVCHSQSVGIRRGKLADSSVDALFCSFLLTPTTSNYSDLKPVIRMAFPNPNDSPDAFMDHLDSLQLALAADSFRHYHARPVPLQSGRFEEHSAQEWCERTDLFLVSTQSLLPPNPF